ncbi:alpha/beta fold hydrolase [Muriicola sp. Z0-33]|uniref:alpha/beta fold hydrolase n=1 Tax=Muriicola sp. Z0-33 TaxID=2816957 RepID=UPI00223905F8|nr:alpha/beta hydrolase [Muriicola sp. Z0-33]MCW5516839.1 alpha/beta hydrolase [Muriicola sp. Z0-33]
MKKTLNKYLPLAYGSYFNILAAFSARTAAQKAFKVFCTPRKGSVLPAQQAFLEQATNGVTQINEQKIQTYQWSGHKETVLLLHGWESNSFRWRKMIGFLQKENYNIISIDAPGHGNSSGEIFNVPLYVDGIREVVSQYQPKYVIAHSVGGMAAIYHQYKYPGNSLEKMVAIGAPSEFSELMDQYKAILKYNSKVGTALDNHVYENYGFRIKDFSTSAFAREITIDGLLIHDELDEIAPVSASERVHANWKNSRLIKTEGLGHSMHQDEVSNSIIDFLKS